MTDWKTIQITDGGIRALDIVTAQRAGFYIQHGTLYSPEGTLIGGDYASNAQQVDLVDDSPIWKAYSPRFTARVEDALWLWREAEGLRIETVRRQTGVVFNLYAGYSYRGYGDDHRTTYLTLHQLALQITIGWHKWMDSKAAHEADRAEKLARRRR